MPLEQLNAKEQRLRMQVWGENHSLYKTLCRLRPSTWDEETAAPGTSFRVDQIRRDCTRIVLKLARIPKW